MKSLISILLLSAAVSAQAQDRTQVCDALAEFAASTAMQKARGLPKDAFLLKHGADLQRVPVQARDAARGTVDWVYARKHITPSEARSGMWNVCLQSLPQ